MDGPDGTAAVNRIQVRCAAYVEQLKAARGCHRTSHSLLPIAPTHCTTADVAAGLLHAILLPDWEIIIYTMKECCFPAGRGSREASPASRDLRSNSSNMLTRWHESAGTRQQRVFYIALQMISPSLLHMQPPQVRLRAALLARGAGGL